MTEEAKCFSARSVIQVRTDEVEGGDIRFYFDRVKEDFDRVAQYKFLKEPPHTVKFCFPGLPCLPNESFSFHTDQVIFPDPWKKHIHRIDMPLYMFQNADLSHVLPNVIDNLFLHVYAHPMDDSPIVICRKDVQDRLLHFKRHAAQITVLVHKDEYQLQVTRLEK